MEESLSAVTDASAPLARPIGSAPAAGSPGSADAARGPCGPVVGAPGAGNPVVADATQTENQHAQRQSSVGGGSMAATDDTGPALCWSSWRASMWCL